MNSIHVLSKHVANQIAAGEVVERPASIVKELVENSIDAGSTAISIEMTDGGTSCIRIADNGAGIPSSDVQTAFLRHATSKISEAEDLARIATLGFRGEALASIAAVAMVSMKTRTRDAEAGSEIIIEGGEEKSFSPAACTDGTSIEVRNLFYNVPARLKFLKSQRAEASYISDYVSRAIMGYPSISFKLVSNGKTVYHSEGDGSLENAVYCVYGGAVLPHLKPLNYDDGSVRITGYVGTERIARPNRAQQSLYVNSRYIRSPHISFAVQRAFDTRLMSGRFPFYVLKLNIDIGEMDVNVHPNKMEVRFKDEERITRAATIAARMALGDPVAPVIDERDILAHVRPAARETQSFGRPAETIALPARLDFSRPVSPVAPVREAAYGEHLRPAPVLDFSAVQPIANDEPAAAAQAVPVMTIPTAKREAAIPAEQVSFGSEPYRIIGQLFRCYWVVQQGEGVFFIDQHAAHERRLYERLNSAGLISYSQQLLVPVIEQLTPLEMETFRANAERFCELGFDVEEFGPLTVSIRAVPDIFESPEAPAFIHDAIAALDAKNRLCATEIKRAALIQSACKHAIKAGAELSQSEIEALLDEYGAAGVPMTCPHGRPVMVRMTRLEFEKLFKRVL